jgi:acyl-CoA thioester hydrolase
METLLMAKSYASAEVEIEIPFHDVDSMKIVWHGNYAKYFEIARCALLESIELNYDKMVEFGYGWPIIDMRIRYPKPARFKQVIKVKADLVEYEECLKINFLITDAKSGERLTRGHTTQVAVNLESGEMLFSTPSIVAKKLGI